MRDVFHHLCHRVNVSTAAIRDREFGLSNTQVGFVFSAFAYPYLLFQIIGGWVGGRFGPRRTLTICSFIWAGATVLTGLAGGLVSLVVPRVLLGLGEGATFPTATRDRADARRRAARVHDEAGTTLLNRSSPERAWSDDRAVHHPALVPLSRDSSLIFRHSSHIEPRRPGVQM